MNILFVVSGTERVAASRYRVYQYLPYLKSHGITCRVFSIISDRATRLAIRSPGFGDIKRLAYYILVFTERFFRFWFMFFAAPSFNLIFLQRATFPFGLGKLLVLRNKKIIFDIDDAIFLPDTPKQDIIARFKAVIKERELKEILSVSACVIVENDYIKDYVSAYCDRVHKIPGPINTDRYFVKGPQSTEYREQRTDGKEQIIIGWIGSPATTVYLHLLDNVFDKILSLFNNVKIVLIGAGNYNFDDERLIRKEWRYETEVSELQEFDIGVMPMPDDEWTKGKLGCKMLQYMAVGVPSVVSYTKTNAEIIRDKENGFLVKNESEWIDTLSRLIKDPGLRADIGSAGRRIVEELCSVKENAPKLMAIFNSLKEPYEIS